MDFELVTKHYGKNVVDRGGKIHLNFEVTGFESVAESQIGSKRGNEYPIRVKGKGDQVRNKFKKLVYLKHLKNIFISDYFFWGGFFCRKILIRYFM